MGRITGRSRHFRAAVFICVCALTALAWLHSTGYFYSTAEEEKIKTEIKMFPGRLLKVDFSLPDCRSLDLAILTPCLVSPLIVWGSGWWMGRMVHVYYNGWNGWSTHAATSLPPLSVCQSESELPLSFLNTTQRLLICRCPAFNLE